MTTLQLTIGICVITTGLFTGLLLTILAIFQQVLKSLSASEFTLVMHRFLKVARRSPVTIFLMLTSILTPVVALIMESDNVGSPLFNLILVGLGVFVVGVFLGSRLFAEPLYDSFLSWTIETQPANWQESRDQWFRVNLIRGAASGIAFILFLIALSQFSQ